MGLTKKSRFAQPHEVIHLLPEVLTCRRICMAFELINLDDIAVPCCHGGIYCTAFHDRMEAQHMLEEVSRLTPLISAQLPQLSRNKHCHNTLPVLCGKKFWIIDNFVWNGEFVARNVAHKGHELRLIRKNLRIRLGGMILSFLEEGLCIEDI